LIEVGRRETALCGLLFFVGGHSRCSNQPIEITATPAPQHR